MLCLLSLFLLWTTTLKIAIGIVGLFFQSPTFSSVHETCLFAYEEVSSQRAKYEDCVTREVSVCDRELQDSFLQERHRSSHILNKNENTLENFRINIKNCSLAVDDSTAALQQWTRLGDQNIIPYLHSCTAEPLEQVQLHLHDNSNIQSAGISDLTSYVEISQHTLHDVVLHSSALGTYNEEYLANKTKILKDAAEKIEVDGTSIRTGSILKINSTISSVLKSVDHLIECIGFSNTTSASSRRKCSAGKGVYDLYAELVEMMEIQEIVIRNNINSFVDTFEEYTHDVEGAISAANNFYDSISGAKGLIRYLVNDLSLFGSSSELCGHTTPNWCSFSKVNCRVCIAIQLCIKIFNNFPFSMIGLSILPSCRIRLSYMTCLVPIPSGGKW